MASPPFGPFSSSGESTPSGPSTPFNPSTPSNPRQLESLHNLKAVGDLTPKKSELEMHEPWLRAARQLLAINKDVHLVAYTDSKDPSKTVSYKFKYPKDLGQQLDNNHKNLHDGLDRIKQMLETDDDILSAETQNEFTRLQVLSSMHFETHYALLRAVFNKLIAVKPLFDELKNRNKIPEKWSGVFVSSTFGQLPTEQLMLQWDNLCKK